MGRFDPDPTLPAPTPEAARHSARLAEQIRQVIAAAGGRISFARYMELVLYAPGLGYYSAGARKFGAAGDFVTAPEISHLFSRCLARQIAEVLGQLGGDVLEVGAGSGVMAAAVIDELAALGVPPRRYLVLERSAELRARQRAALEAAPGRGRAGVPIEWLDDLPAPGFHGVVVANELLDAFPAHRFCIQEGRVEEFYVGCSGDHFVWALGPPETPAVAQAVAELQRLLGRRLPAGYVSEVSPARRAWVGELGRRVERGVVLLVDYGYPRAEYYHPQRTRGTLTCFYRHRAHSEPLLLPGLQDISVHVDFSDVAAAAREAGFEVVGYTTQADFLIALGLLAMLQADRAHDGSREADHLALASEVKRLIMPGDLGELVKVMGLARGWTGPLQGFAGSDRSDWL